MMFRMNDNVRILHPDDQNKPRGEWIDGRLYYTVKDYAAVHKIGLRTITRGLPNGEFPGAFQKDDGLRTWMVPADAERVKGGSVPDDEVMIRPTAGVALPSALPNVPKNAPALEDLLKAEPANIPLDRASIYSGLTVHWLKTHKEQYGIEPGGERGTLVMPKREILRLAGLIG